MAARPDPDALVESIYEAAVAPPMLSRLLDRMAEYFGATAANINVVDPAFQGGDLSVSIGIAPECIAAYAEHYWQCDEWRRGAEQLPHPPFVPTFGDQLVPDQQLARSEFHAEYLRQLDVFHWLGAIVERSSTTQTVVSFQRPRRHGPFDARDAAALARLVPHLGRAVRVLGSLATERALGLASLELLEDGRMGLALVSRDGRVLHLNREARRIVALGDGIAAARSALLPARATEVRMLARMLGRAIRGSPRGAGAMAVPRPSGRRAFLLRVVPLTGDEEWPGVDPPAAAILLTDPEAAPAPRAEDLERWFALRPAEARLASRIAAGETVDAAAAVLGLTPGSARVYLGRIYRRTDTHGLAEFVRLLHRTPG